MTDHSASPDLRDWFVVQGEPGSFDETITIHADPRPPDDGVIRPDSYHSATAALRAALQASPAPEGPDGIEAECRHIRLPDGTCGCPCHRHPDARGDLVLAAPPSEALDTDRLDPALLEDALRMAGWRDIEGGFVAVVADHYNALAAPPSEPEPLALDLPGHKCRKIAEVAPLDPGREVWLGELTEPYPGFEHETHCLHVTTPHKSVVFGVWRADFDILAVLGYIVDGRGAMNERWLRSRAEHFRRLATPASEEAPE